MDGGDQLEGMNCKGEVGGKEYAQVSGRVARADSRPIQLS